MKIKNLKRVEGRVWDLVKEEFISTDCCWVWDIVRDEDDYDYDDRYAADVFPNTVRYYTNDEGEGLWEESPAGYDWDGEKWVQATEMRQIEGTCQYTMRGCNTKSGARSHIRRYFFDKYTC